MKRIHINSYDGTHVKAPIRCNECGKTLDDYKIGDFYGDCVMNGTSEDIQLGVGIIFIEQITIEIAKHIVKIIPKFVGLTAEVDEVAEHYLLNKDIILFEKLVHTEKLPNKFLFYGIPLKIKKGDRGPVRAFTITSR